MHQRKSFAAPPHPTIFSLSSKKNSVSFFFFPFFSFSFLFLIAWPQHERTPQGWVGGGGCLLTTNSCSCVWPSNKKGVMGQTEKTGGWRRTNLTGAKQQVRRGGGESWRREIFFWLIISPKDFQAPSLHSSKKKKKISFASSIVTRHIPISFLPETESQKKIDWMNHLEPRIRRHGEDNPFF